MSKIGSVKVDIHKDEHHFRQISFSDVDCIKGLIKNRWLIDPYYGLERNNHYNFAGTILPMNQELICVFVDLDRLIHKVKLSKKQLFIISKLMQGYSEEEVAESLNNEVSTINRTLDTISRKIKKINDNEWKYDYIYLNYLKVDWNYKQCPKCKEFKPKTEEFFRARSDSYGDGFYNNCRECEN